MIEILLATYNGEAYLEAQIQSILGQTFENFQLVIRDDGSTDMTQAIISKYCEIDSRVYQIKDTLGNLGYVENFMQLLKQSKATWVMLCDQDDVWNLDKIESMIAVRDRIFERNSKQAILIHHDSQLVNQALLPIGQLIGSKAERKGLENYMFSNVVQSASCMLNRSLVKKVLNHPKGMVYHDKYIHIIAELLGERVYMPMCLMQYRQHGANAVGQEKLVKKIFRFLKNGSSIFLPWEREAVLYIAKTFDVSQGHQKILDDYLYLTDVEIKKSRRLKRLRSTNLYIPWKKKLAYIFFGK